MERWRAVGRGHSQLKRDDSKWSPGGSVRPVVADSHHFDEKQGSGSGPALK
jgi:hypothetical protein